MTQNFNNQSWGLDEFELKPLTPGLGFHPRQSMLPNRPSSPSASTPKPQSKVNKILKPSYLESSHRSTEPEGEELISAQQVLSQLPQQRSKWVTKENPSSREVLLTSEPGYRTPSRILQVWLMDGLVLLALGLLGLVGWISLAGETFFHLWLPASTLQKVMLLTGYGTVLTIAYNLGFRLFLGQTLGEWSENITLSYFAKSPALQSLSLFGRALLTPFSIILAIGLLSVIFKKDLLGVLTGTELIVTSE